MNDRITKLIASTGLITGGILGMVGSFVSSPMLRGLAWGLDGVALVLACGLLTVYYFRKENDIVASGFLIFAIGEGFILSCSAINLDEDLSTFGAGTALWATSLSLISFQKLFPILVRCLGLIAALLFSVVSVLIFIGQPINPLSEPLPFFAYPFFAATIFGWAFVLLRTE